MCGVFFSNNIFSGGFSRDFHGFWSAGNVTLLCPAQFVCSFYRGRFVDVFRISPFTSRDGKAMKFWEKIRMVGGILYALRLLCNVLNGFFLYKKYVWVEFLVKIYTFKAYPSNDGCEKIFFQFLCFLNSCCKKIFSQNKYLY